MRRLLLAALCAPALAAATAQAQAPSPLPQAREELGIERPLPSRWPLPNGDLEIGPSELLASAAGARIRLTVRLERPEPGGALLVDLPGTRPGRSGLPGLRAPRRLAIRFAGDGLEHSETVEHVGLPAGTYALPLTWHDGRAAGTARLRVLAAPREARAEPGDAWRAMDVSADGADQSEAFSAVAPGDPRRIAVAANPDPIEQTMSAWLSETGGTAWQRHPLPEALDVPGSDVPEPSAVCCDPMLAITDRGDVWVGGITSSEGPPGSRSRIVVNRLPAAGRPGFAAQSVGLPARTEGTQDKPMIAAHPDGRLLVVWLEPDAAGAGAVSVVLSACHTALGPAEDPGAWCESADHWTAPVPVTPAPGSYTYPDVAAAPGGDVHVTWWDYSAAENGVRGATCAAPCSGSFAAPRTIALLDATGGRPLPFGCPIPVAPGGRAGAAPSVEAAPDGRVWVAWADLRPGSGTTRCEGAAGGGYTAPRATHLSWDAFAAARRGELPGGTAPSATAGTPLVVDGDEGVAGSSDDFLPSLAVDPVTGDAWASAYSTGHDPRRESAHYVATAIAPGPGDALRVGPAVRVSAAPSTFSGESCCAFANDFGDYAGLAVSGDVVVPAWIARAPGGDADLWAAPGALPTVGFDLLSPGAAEMRGDGDGRIEAGEGVLLRPLVENTGTRIANRGGTGGPAGTLTDAAGTVRGSLGWPALPPGGRALPDGSFLLDVPEDLPCGRQLTARLGMASAQGAETLAIAVPVDCPPGVEPVPEPDPEEVGPDGLPVRGTLAAFSVVPGQRLGTVLRRGLLVSARCTGTCRTTITADLRRGLADRLRLRRRMAYASATFGARDRRVRVPVRARARRLLLRGRAPVRLRVRIFAAGRRRTAYVTVPR